METNKEILINKAQDMHCKIAEYINENEKMKSLLASMNEEQKKAFRAVTISLAVKMAVEK